jgi:dihydroorotate dehydrogenase
MLWKLAKPVLFRLDPERAHHLTLALLKRLPFSPRRLQSSRTFQIAGLSFPNLLGLAAGMDKNGECLMAWQSLGFGFTEVGTVTALPQAGNPKPRLFRLLEHAALFNRMGFNNDGAEVIAKRIEKQRRNSKLTIPIGINIGKSAVVPLDDAALDYLASFRLLADVADYVAINVSSPNTKNLRQLQDVEALKRILTPIANENQRSHSPKPLFVKIAPDLRDEEAVQISKGAILAGATGLIVSNTTTQNVGACVLPSGGGGLSGAPLLARSTSLLKALRSELGKNTLLVGSGGVMCPDDAVTKLNEGADLVQIYTGFVYGGPSFPRMCVKAIEKML